MPLIPKLITGVGSGLTKNKKPYLIPEDAWQTLENAYVWRERLVKRKGVKQLGRLRRALVALAEPNTTGAGTYQANDLLSSVRATEPNAEIQSGNLTFRIDPGGANQTVYKDTAGDGVLVWQSGPFTISEGHVNYVTGQLNLTFIVVPGVLTTNVDLHYFPSLPVMAITQREIATLNEEQTLWFDEKYVYAWNGSAFDEFITGTTWASTDADFFWCYNYIGATPAIRLLFVTNFVNDAANPMRYTDGATWTTFSPLITALNTLFSGRIIVAYYGRLLVLNTYEGVTAAGPGAAINFPQRCRFSQLGDPTAADAYRTDIFGKGGAIDAPTTEKIVSAMFVKNTLIVQFERSTWELRYVGEYGLPFLWERISSDFGSESTFSSILFDNNMLSVGDKAITTATGNSVQRIDLDIPDQVFEIENENHGPTRVWGERDYRDELIYWCYPDTNTQAFPGINIKFPNKVLVYNYRNNTWAIFRDNVTAFGTFQLDSTVTWDSTDIFWDDEDIFWDGVDDEAKFPEITSGNAQGFVFLYNYQTPDETSLSIKAIDLTTSPISVTSPNHNLQNGEIIRITGLQFLDASTFLPVATNLNNQIYQVQPTSVDAFNLLKWDRTSYANNFTFTPTNPVLYVGKGEIALFPVLNITTKDFSLFMDKGLQTKLSHIDFLVRVSRSSAMTVNLLINASNSVTGNVLVGNRRAPTSQTPPFYPPDGTSDYGWFSFYATTVGQFFNINITYDDTLMNDYNTQLEAWELMAINAMVRPGGGMTNG